MIETERLLLREYTPDDFNALFEIVSDPETMAHYEGLKEIRVRTNSNLIAPRNYESVGFVLYDRKKNPGETAFSGDNLYYRIQLKEEE